MSAQTNAERQARYRAKWKAPVIWDHDLNAMRPVTQDDVSRLVHRAGEAAELRRVLMVALGLPPNALEQVARLQALGGLHGAPKGSA